MSLHIIECDDGFVVQAADYRVTFLPRRLLAILEHNEGLYYGMGLLSAINAPEAIDRASAPPRIEITHRTPEMIGVTLHGDSSIWRSKTHHYNFFSDHIDYRTELEGNGRIDRAYFFQGWLNGAPLACVPGFRRIFHPQPNFLEHQEFAAHEHIRFAAGHDDWVIANVRGNGLHGSPLCWIMEDDDAETSLSMGLLVKTGRYNFETVDLNYLDPTLRENPDHLIGTQALSIGYHGHEHVNGRWVSPTLTLRFTRDRFAALRQYVNDLRRFGGMHERQRSYQPWTRRPIYCTWHDQVAMALSRGNTAELASPAALPADGPFTYCTQPLCERWLKLLLDNDIDIGTFIIDATWQTHPGDPAADARKFPDLRGFIDRCHERDIRVILWANAWDRSGVPDAECLTRDGRPMAADPTHPDYQQRLARMIHRMISDAPGCYNADGVKLDGMTNTPCGPTLRTHDGTTGFELARRLCDLWSSNIAATKPDAVLGLFTAFPYFADRVDMARTGDLYTVKGDPLSANRFRAAMIRAVMPDVAIDMDGAQRFNNVLPFASIIDASRRLGVPCLYEIERLVQRRDFLLPQLRMMEPQHYQAIRQTLRRGAAQPVSSTGR